jgi:hypothetical protein
MGQTRNEPRRTQAATGLCFGFAKRSVISADSCEITPTWPSRTASHDNAKLSAVAFRPAISGLRATVTPNIPGSVILSRWSHPPPLQWNRWVAERRRLLLPTGSCEQLWKHKQDGPPLRMCQIFFTTFPRLSCRTVTHVRFITPASRREHGAKETPPQPLFVRTCSIMCGAIKKEFAFYARLPVGR